ncbi:MAG: phytanoyl-CoA dioxygenase family protein [Planctomycetes bacterium]|nr:phytanoyl-CoA dioxygenase family protein [Planctomycetota bacterium]
MPDPDLDLVRAHAPVTDAFPGLREADDIDRFRLDETQVAHFEEHGYVAGIRILDDAQVQELRTRLETLRTRIVEGDARVYEVEAAWRERPDEVVFHFLGAWMVDAWFHDLIFHPAATVPMAQLLGVERLRFWHDQVFHKPPGHPGCVPWHQDYSYWTRTTPARHLTLNVVLDDADEENGCIQFVPGSHRWPLQPQVPFDADMGRFEEGLPQDLRDAFRPVPIPLNAGEASIHHSHLVHGSGPNAAGRPRRALVLNTMAPHVRVADASRPLLDGVPLIAEGEVVQGDHFPIVLDLTAALRVAPDRS